MQLTLKEFKNTSERQFLINAICSNNWNLQKTARELKIQRSHIYNLIAKYRITKTDEAQSYFPEQIFSPTPIVLPDFDYSGEYWAAYPKNTFYYVSNMGRVKTVQGDMLSIAIQAHTYPCVSVNIEGKFITKPTHRLVAETFIPNPENKPEVNHKNRIKLDSRLDNLEWVTQSENVIHSMKTKIGEHKSAVKKSA